MAHKELVAGLEAILTTADRVGFDDPTIPAFAPHTVKAAPQFASDAPLHNTSIRSAILPIAGAYRSGRSAPGTVVHTALSAAEGSDNAFLRLTPAEARTAAAASDARFSDNAPVGLLDGIPIAVKDVIDIAGHPTTGGSALFKDRVAATDGECVARLKQAGAAIIGKTVLHEWAYGVTSDNPAHGRVGNPRARGRIPGGSSGGSAAAVAAGIVPAALGSDTGGSVRIPACCCGIVGFKPSYDLISRQGGVPQAWSLDHIGPLTETVADAWLMTAAASGSQALMDRFTDSFASGPTGALNGMALGIPSNWERGVSDEVAEAVGTAIGILTDAGARISTFDYPDTDVARAAWLMIIISESAAYHREHMKKHPEAISDDVRVFLQAGGEARAVDYLRAQQFRRAWCREVADAMGGFDAVISPTLPDVPPEIGQEILTLRSGPTPVRDAMVTFQWPANLLGAPSLSLPLGTRHALPTGLMVTGRYGCDGDLLHLAARIENCLTLADGTNDGF
ncbi:amidase [Fodinicurvata sp. EGI_FJ10296]|uniref:amidase n=1 Tax=Fodinicurvata sp. EGI_FJ10296 TaxID=3231908 RepID=UPI003455D0D8